MNTNMYRYLLTFVLLCPYFVFYRMNHKDTPFWQDMLFAALAFGIGHLVFPDKRLKQQKEEQKKKDERIIDQDN